MTGLVSGVVSIPKKRLIGGVIEWLFGSYAFTPLSLFAASEQGVWYDPSDFSTMFQGSTGTTPVTAVEQPVGLILDKSKGLVLGPEINPNGAANWLGGYTLDGTRQVPNGYGLYNGANVSAMTVAPNSLQFTATGHLGGLIPSPLPGVWPMRVPAKVVIKARKTALVSGTPSLNILVPQGWTTVVPSGAALNQWYEVTVYPSSSPTNLEVSNFNGAASWEIEFISIKYLPGNHALQATAAARPVVSARVNLLTYTEDLSNASWVKSLCTATSDVSDPLGGTSAFTITATSAHGRLARSDSEVTTTSGVTYTISAYIRRRTGTGDVQFYSCSAADYFSPTLALTTEWQRFTWTFTSTSTLADIRLLHIYTSGDAIDVWHPQLEIASTATRYQRVTTATDYDTVGFPHYLAFDGIDDSLATAAIDLSGTSQLSVFAAWAAQFNGIFAALYGNGVANYAGSGGYFAANATEYTSSTARFDFGGTSFPINEVVTVPINTALVSSQLLDSTASPYQIVRIDGVESATWTSDHGGLPFANAVVKIGHNGHIGSAHFFNGKMYGFVIRGAESSATEIENTEAYIASKSGVTL